MKLIEYLLMLVKAYNPNQYGSLTERPGKEFVTFAIITVLLSLVVFTAFLVPITFRYIENIPATVGAVDQLELSASVKTNGSVQLLERPPIILDLDANTTTDGAFVLSEQGLLYPKYLFFGNAVLPWSDIRDLKQQTPARDRLLGGVIIFLLPSIIFWFFLVNLIKIGILFLVLSLLGTLVPRMFKHRILYGEAAKVTILALPSILFLDIGLYPLAPLFWWGLLLTVVFFGVGIALVSELDYEHPGRQSIKAKQKQDDR